MLNPTPAPPNKQMSKFIFILTLGAAIYFFIIKSINVYSSALGGIIYEILWLPSLIVLFILPVVSFIFWVREKFKLKSLNLCSIIVAVLVVLSIVLIK